MLSFLTYHRFAAEVKGLDHFDRNQWSDNIPLVYYAYHIMVGLGTYFVALITVAFCFLLARNLDKQKWLLWLLFLSFPFPFIANTAGWITTELEDSLGLSLGF